MNRVWTRKAAYAALVMLFIGQRPGAAEAGTTESIRQRFIGTWRLVVDENISKDGR